MTLDVFTIKLGGESLPVVDNETRGLVAVKVLDAIQTVVDVLTDNDGGKGWTVSFDPGLNAYTDRTSGRRAIVVSGKPLFDAKPGDPLDRIAAIMTGFAVHEVGHTKLDFFEAVRLGGRASSFPSSGQCHRGRSPRTADRRAVSRLRRQR